MVDQVCQVTIDPVVFFKIKFLSRIFSYKSLFHAIACQAFGYFEVRVDRKPILHDLSLCHEERNISHSSLDEIKYLIVNSRLIG